MWDLPSTMVLPSERVPVLTVAGLLVADRDEADPGHPLSVGEDYARVIPGARLVVEEAGRSPIAWQGGQLSKVIAEAAAGAGR